MVYQLFLLLVVYGKGFPVDSSPCIYLYFSFRPPSRRGFLILRGWRAVGLGPERLGLMAFSLGPVGTRRFFFSIASAARSLCT